jgi:hypothetical protein
LPSTPPTATRTTCAAWLRLSEGAYQPAAATSRPRSRHPGSFGNPHLGTAGGDLAALYYAGVAYQKMGDDAARSARSRASSTCARQLADRQQGRAVAVRWQAENFRARAQARLGLPASEPARLPGGDESTYFVQTPACTPWRGGATSAQELARGEALGSESGAMCSTTPTSSRSWATGSSSA